MGRAIIVLWATTLLLGFIGLGWWIFSSERSARIRERDAAEATEIPQHSSPVSELQSSTQPKPKVHQALGANSSPVGQKCSGIFLKSALPVEDNGDEQQRCYPGLNPNSPEVCTDPRPVGDRIEPSQIWTNHRTGKQTVCEHGGYCYPMAAVKLNPACNVPGAVGRYAADSSE